MFNLSYLFNVLFLILLVFIFMLGYMANFIYLKFLVILVYVSGIVVFILYISCLCWNVNFSFSKYFLVLSLVVINVFNEGVSMNFSEMGYYLWMYVFFSLLFNVLVTSYSLSLFKVAGSLRF